MIINFFLWILFIILISVLVLIILVVLALFYDNFRVTHARCVQCTKMFKVWDSDVWCKKCRPRLPETPQC